MTDEKRLNRPENDPARREVNPEERRDWETLQTNGLDDETQRLRIVGGWLYRTISNQGVALVFVPSQASEVDA